MIELFGSSAYDAKDHGAGSMRLVNCYLAPGEGGTIRNFPGLREWATVPGELSRRIGQAEDQIYTLSSGNLSKITPSGGVSQIANVPDDPNCTIFGARGRVAVTSGGAYYLWDGETFTQPGGGRLTSIGSAVFVDDFVLLSERNGREIEWTAVGDPATRNALNYNTAGARDDNIVRLISVGSYVWVMKERSLEVWARGSLPPIWNRLPGAVRTLGLKAFNLVVAGPEVVFFIGNDDVAYFGSGIDARPVSPPWVDRALADGVPTHCFYFEELGHRFFVIRFSDRPAIIYDAAGGTWAERDFDGGAFNVVGSAYSAGKWRLLGLSPRVMTLDRVPHDLGRPMRRRAVSRTIRDERLFTVARLQVLGSLGDVGVTETAPPFVLEEDGTPMLGEDGRPLTTEDGLAYATWRRGPKIGLRVSRTGGKSWGLTKYRDLGWPGDYSRQVTFAAMGQFRTFTVELSCADPVEVAFRAGAFVS
jgi:hypothetical protein